MMADIYQDKWGADALARSRILAKTQEIFGKAIAEGTPKHTPHRKAFEQQLRESTNVFAAFRVHTQASQIAAMMTDDKGNKLPFAQWAEKVQPLLNHQNRAWLQTEYSTATRRAHDEADWQRFKEDADIYPNLEWMPTTSATPGKDHQPYWGTVLPMDDPFWSEHRPGDRWNCKCSLRSTDKGPTNKPHPTADTNHQAQAGLKTKPASGEVFSEDHAYYPKGCSVCVWAQGANKLLARLSAKHKPLSKDGTCLGCKVRQKCIKRGAGQTDHYTPIPTKRGEVRVHDKHGKQERASNAQTATYLAEKHGYNIDLLPVNNEGYTADSYNHTLGKEQEYKDIKTPTDNAIQKQIQKGCKQANSIVLVLKEEVSVDVIRHAVCNRVNRCENITDVTIIMGGKDVTYSRAQLEDKLFKVRKEDFK